MASRDTRPSLDVWAILGLLCEQDAHGWALVRAVAPQGEIGRVWSIRRAIVYRTLGLMIDAALVEPAAVEQGARGGPRTVLRATTAGRGELQRWLAEPVPHVRDLRSGLLLKLVLAQRSGLDTRPLLDAQRTILAQTIQVLESQRVDEQPGTATIHAFRLEAAHAGLRFVDAELTRGRHDHQQAHRPDRAA
jgi:DNA-binding PadR family transcriptional regulator